MTDKEFYIKYLPGQLPLFYQPDWLDTVAPNWDVILKKQDGKIIAVMPYVYSKMNKSVIVHMPPLTPYLGPFLLENEKLKTVTRISHQIHVLEEFVDALPSFSYFRQRWSYELMNSLPFLWKGYDVSVKYTYCIFSPIDLENVWSNLKDTNRRLISVGQKRLQLEESSNYGLLFDFIQKTFKRKSNEMALDRKLFLQVGQVLEKNKSGKILLARNGSEVEAGALFAWDDSKIYYLIGGLNTDIRQNGAMNFLLYNGIKMAAETNRTFDFEGSVIKEIEHFFRSFGGELIPYLVVSKRNISRKDSLKMGLKQVFNSFR